MGVICILVAIGIFLQKTGVIDNLSSKKLSAIVVDVCNPALIMASILGGNITATHRDLLYAAGLGEQIEGMVKELYAGYGAVRKTLHKYVSAR